MKKDIILTTPMSDEAVLALKAGDMAYITGHIYTGRDAAHKRLADMLAAGEEMPFDFVGQVIYYAGPCPAKPGQVIGSVGPTTSGRMDAYSPMLIEKGLKIMIGKGLRSQKVIDEIVARGGVYFAAVGGAAAYMAKCVTASEMVAFSDLGTEAIRRLTVERFPVIVAVDSKGNSVY